MRTLVVLLLSIFVVSGAQAAGETRDPYTYFFEQSLGDLTEDLDTAREQGKKAILIMFEMDECPFCHRMKTTVLNRPDVQDFFKANFYSLPIDIEGDIEIIDFQGNATTMKEFAAKNRVRATPVFAFFDLQGRPIKRARYTGATRDAEEFLLLGQYVVSGAYQKTSFTRFKRQFRKP